jgi:hypothetical protein
LSIPLKLFLYPWQQPWDDGMVTIDILEIDPPLRQLYGYPVERRE